MTDAKPMTNGEVLAKLREEIAEQRRAAEAEPDPAKREQLLHDADTREDLVEEETEAIAESAQQSKDIAAAVIASPHE